MDNKIINPLTNRPITKNGPTHLKLIKEGKLDEDGNIPTKKPSIKKTSTTTKPYSSEKTSSSKKSSEKKSEKSANKKMKKVKKEMILLILCFMLLHQIW